MQQENRWENKFSTACVIKKLIRCIVSIPLSYEAVSSSSFTYTISGNTGETKKSAISVVRNTINALV